MVGLVTSEVQSVMQREEQMNELLGDSVPQNMFKIKRHLALIIALGLAAKLRQLRGSRAGDTQSPPTASDAHRPPESLHAIRIKMP